MMLIYISNFTFRPLTKRSHALSPINYSRFLKVPFHVKFTLARLPNGRVCLQPVGELHRNEESPSFTPFLLAALDVKSELKHTVLQVNSL